MGGRIYGRSHGKDDGENLSIGIDPITGRVLPKYDSCANEVVQEALRTVLDNCSLESYGTILEKQRAEREEKKKERKAQRAERYTNGVNHGQKPRTSCYAKCMLMPERMFIKLLTS